MPMMSIPDLLLHELGDLLFAEKTVLKALPKMIRETSGEPVRARMEAHLEETRQQVTNLERAFEALGERAKAEKCPGILGLVKEHDDFKSEEEPSKPILEAFDLGSGLRVEHYEIAAYTTAIALARNLGMQQVIDLLQANLDQERAMAEFLESAAPMALETARANAEAIAARATSKRATKQASKRGASKRGGATKAAARKGGATRGAAKKGAAKQAGARKGGARKGGAKKATAKKGGTKRAARR